MGWVSLRHALIRCPKCVSRREVPCMGPEQEPIRSHNDRDEGALSPKVKCVCRKGPAGFGERPSLTLEADPQISYACKECTNCATCTCSWESSTTRSLLACFDGWITASKCGERNWCRFPRATCHKTHGHKPGLSKDFQLNAAQKARSAGS